MQCGFIAELSFRRLDHAFVVEDEFGQFPDVDPFGVVFVAELFLVLVDIDEGEVSDAEGAFYGVAERFAEGAELFHVEAFETGKFFQDAVGCLLEAFFLLQKAFHCLILFVSS